MTSSSSASCPFCEAPTSHDELGEAGWLDSEVLGRIASKHPSWRRQDGACPACVQHALLEILLNRGDAALHESIQAVWPLDAEAAFGALPTPLRMHADPHYTGRGVTLGMVDAAFYPHPDLVKPVNRIRAWVDASREPVQALEFAREETPTWPGWNSAGDAQWHGLMTSVTAAGNGALSHGLYAGLASQADVVLVQVRDQAGHISSASIARALHWLHQNASRLHLRVVNLSVAGDPASSFAANPVDEAVSLLVTAGVIIVAAAGNDGYRQLLPPATAPNGLTVGGLDDKNVFDHAQVMLWHSNYGESVDGAFKPELVAPSIWVVAPLLPDTRAAGEAKELFERRARGDASANAPIIERKLVTPHYQLVEGTSFAAPLVSSIVACMLEANPSLRPDQVRQLLLAASSPVPGAPLERQGAGAVDAGRAVALAMRARNGPLEGYPVSPHIQGDRITFVFYRQDARRVQILGSWNNWRAPGLVADEVRQGVWWAELGALPPGRYAYKFLLDGERWLDDPSNPHKVPDGLAGFNSLLIVADAAKPNVFP